MSTLICYAHTKILLILCHSVNVYNFHPQQGGYLTASGGYPASPYTPMMQHMAMMEDSAAHSPDEYQPYPTTPGPIQQQPK